MTRTFGTITWGLALIVSAGTLALTQSLPWTLTAAGAVPVIAGIISAQMGDDEVRNAKRVKEQGSRPKYDASRSDFF